MVSFRVCLIWTGEGISNMIPQSTDNGASQYQVITVPSGQLAVAKMAI